jgi:hypothetical protein
MASTPIYNWPTPDNTDLVKNGALAIRTLGDAIDTTMDTMIPETIFAAKGDLLGASANDTPAVLTVGANGETLVADSSTSTGLRYTAGTVQANPVLNSAMQVWQRGTSFSLAASTPIASGFSADRWQTTTGANQACTLSRQATGDTTNLPFIQYALRYQRNSGQTGTGTLTIAQNIETINSVPFAGKAITMSFYARAGANYSATSSILQVRLDQGNGTDLNVFTGFGSGGSIVSQNATLTTTWQRFTYTATMSATSTQLAPYFNFIPTGTAGAADYFEITGVQIDIGSVALPFRTYAGTIQGELAACQRYYWRFTNAGAGNNYIGIGTYYTTTQCYWVPQWPVQMRIAPNVTVGDATKMIAVVAGAQRTASAFAADVISTNYADLYITTPADTAGRGAIVGFLTGANAYLDASAEL